MAAGFVGKFVGKVLVLDLAEFSDCQQVRLQLGVAVGLSPESKGNGSKLVHCSNREAVFCEVYSFEVTLAGVTGFDAHVRELFRGEYCE